MKKIKNYIKNHKTISIVLIIAMIIAIGTAVFLTISYNTEKQRYDAVKAYCNNNDSFAIQTEYELDKQEHELNVNNLVVTSMPNYSSVYNERICVGEYNRSFVGDDKFVADKAKKETYTIRTEVPKNKIWNSFKHIDTPVEISCIDTTAPEFTEKTDTITINKGDKLDVVSKFKATDLSGTVEIKTDSVDVNKVGEQIVNVFATDGSGNVAQTEVKVVVNEPEKQKSEDEQTTQTSEATTPSKSTTTASKSSSDSKSKKSSTTASSSSSKSKTKSSSSSSSSKKSTTSSKSTTKKSETTKKTPYWCTEGGTHHVIDEGHGWYKSYKDAEEASAKNSASTTARHYEIQECPCGLFTYYWGN
mgnify:CR=1 FL=1